jgi:hypothetical protein
MKYLLSTMKTAEISTVVAKSTIRTEWFLKRWNIFRIAVKTVHPLTGNCSIDVIIFLCGSLYPRMTRISRLNYSGYKRN